MFGSTCPKSGYFASGGERTSRRGRAGWGQPDFFASGREGTSRKGRSCRSQRFDKGWGEERRTPRGDIKFILLTLLAEQPQHGYQLIKELENRYGGFYRPSPGSVYPTLQLLEEGGYLTSEQVEGKRVYTITDSGRQLLAERENPVDLTDRADSQLSLIELKDALTELSGVVMLVARSGNLERVSQVRDILNRVKREIYTILAQED